MKRVETWLAQSLRWRRLLQWASTSLEVLAYYNCYLIHQQIDGKEMAAHAACSVLGISRAGYPAFIFACLLVITGNLGYRICKLSQHNTEVPRVVLNQGRCVTRNNSAHNCMFMLGAVLVCLIW